MILTREQLSCRRKLCPSATLSNTNLAFANLASNQVLLGERPTTDLVNHGTASID